MKCKKCKNSMIERGFKSNRRYECKGCGFIKVTLFSRTFGSYMGYPKYLDKWKTFVFMLFFSLVFVGFVNAVECSVSLENSCTVATSFDFPGTNIYNFNGTSATSGAINIAGHNVILNCLNSQLIGNNTYIGIRNNGFDNVTVKKCQLTNYTDGMWFVDALNSTFLNNIIQNMESDGIEIIRSHNSLFQNNSVDFSMFNGLNIDESNFTIADGNTITNNYRSITAGRGIRNINSFFNNLTNNNISHIYTYGIFNFNSSDTLIEGNTIYNITAFAIFTRNNGDNSIVRYNYVDLTDIGVYGEVGDGYQVYGNIINRTIKTTDGWNVGIYIDTGINHIVYNNTLEEGGTIGILIRGVNNSRFYNNSCQAMSFADRISYGNSWDSNEPIMCYGVLQNYKTFLGNNREDGDPFNSNSILATLESHNISITETTIGSIIQVPFRVQGGTNISTDFDFSQMWLRSFLIRNETTGKFSDRDYIYISNSFTNLSSINKTTLTINNYLGQGNNDANNPDITYREFSNFEYFRNNNDSITFVIEIFEKSNALIYINQSNAQCTNINSCDDNINITLIPNQYSYVLENFNLTEGETRKYSPLWFSSSAPTSKDIASNLTNTINSTISFEVNSCNINSLSYLSDTGTYSKSYSSNEWNCSSNVITLIVEGIESASNSNVLTISYLSSGSGGGGDGEIKECTSSWSCSEYGECINKTQTRECIDLNNCSSSDYPVLSESCGLEKNEITLTLFFSAIILIFFWNYFFKK